MLSITLSIFLVNLHIISCAYLDTEANYHKPKLERNNIVNKGVWVKNKSNEHLFAKTSLGNFIFRTNSGDADRQLQSSFDTMPENNMDDTPSVTNYVERVRRSPDQIRKLRTRKSLKTINNLSTLDDSKSIHSKIVASLKPSSVFNKYPYEVALVLNNRKPATIINNNRENKTHTEATINDKKTSKVHTPKANKADNTTDTIHPKRNRKHNFDSGKNEQSNILRVMNITEDIDDPSKMNRINFDKDDRVQRHQIAPIPDSNMYVVVPKEEKTKAVTERGLIKVLSMLTKTFKKIMKQHTEVKIIYDKFNKANDAFIKQVNDIHTKFQDFDSKYSDMIQFNDKLKSFEAKLHREQEYLKIKHKNMEDNVLEFRNQQKIFLAQQKQFFNLQNVMLAEAEKINVKQSVIAKTQSEISYRQNNFARIFKKTKQIIDARQPNTTDKEDNLKVLNTIRYTKTTDVTTTTEVPTSTDPVKLNLFSIPTESKLSNQDEEIINEKDEKPIDDLVYKYYFNNTFIDNLMRSKFLNNYVAHTNNAEDSVRNAKNKRGETKTILLPVSNNMEINTHNRTRRWVSRMKSNMHKKTGNKTEKKILETNPEFMKKDATSNDPFLTMAKAFCNEIGQNTNEQTLKWCVEKSLRRLKFMDKKLFSKSATYKKDKNLTVKLPSIQSTTEIPKITLYPVAPSTVWLATNIAVEPSTSMYAVANQEIFFPDNEELESNLKQYDLTPDNEGTVYYDGSVHLSDVGKNGDYNNGGMSDFISRIEDISQAEMDLAPFDIEARRRAYVVGMQQNMQRLHSRKL